MIINHNIAALNTYRQLSSNTTVGNKSLEKLSAGLRINKAGDDAAGLAISEKMRGQIRGLDQATRNAQDGISLIQTAEGALNETHSILQRMRELAVQSSTDTNASIDREKIQQELEQLSSEIDRISSTTEFNTKKLLDGNLEKASAAAGTKLASTGLDGTATQGTATGLVALAANTTISTGVNDQIKIAVDGEAAVEITIAQNSGSSQYTRTQLVEAINAGIGSSSLAGTVTASLDSNNMLVFRSASEGGTSTIAVTAGTASGDTQLGFVTGTVTDGTSAVSNDISAGLTVNVGSNAVKLTVGGKTVDNVNLTDSNPGLATLKNDEAGKTALQNAFDATFGKGAVTVAISGTGLQATSSLGNVSIAAASMNSVGLTAAAGATYAADTFNAGTAVDGVDSVAIATGATALVTLGDGHGNNLGLRNGNQINITALVGGVEKTGTLTVSGTTTDLDDLAAAIRDTIGGAAGVAVDSNGKIQITGALGEAYAVSNVTLSAQVSASDATAIAGNFGNIVSAFEETQAASDEKLDSSMVFQIGSNQNQTMKVDINEMSVNSLKLTSVDISTQAGAATAVTVLDNAIQQVSEERSKLGAYQNRLEHTINNIGTTSENLTASESRVRDVDMAKEMMEFTKNNILSQAATAMLAQANQQPQQVLKLLQ